MLPQSVDELAARLGLEASQLTVLGATADRRYRHHRIPKANGRTRHLAEPDRLLKATQRRLLDRVLSVVPLHPAATAFHPGAAVQANAAAHAGQGFVFSTDLVDFFPSITAPRVAGLCRALGAPAEVAALLAKLVCHRGRLAQGAPTSPTVANLVARQLDLRLSGFCERRGWTYTRYADDLTISGPGRFEDRDREWIGRCVEEEGFVLHHDKTRLARRHEAQVVTGLSVNAECRLPREERRKIRAMCHQAKRDPAAFAGRTEELRGRLSWLRAIEPRNPDLAEYEAVLEGLVAARAAAAPGAGDVPAG